MTDFRATHRGTTEHRMYGRDRELAELYEVMDGVCGRGAALLIRGEPGIGKTALLTAASRRAEATGMRMLRATGVQSEARMPFAGLHQLVQPVLGKVELLPAPQREALLAAFGMIEAAEPERFLIGVAVLELLSDVAESSPLLIVADDAQWFDRSSAGVLAFLSRRIEHERIVMLVAGREGEESSFDAVGLPELHLGGLDDASAGSLLAAHGRRLEPVVRQRLLEQAAGNPLALMELPILLGKDVLDGHSPLPALLPLTERLERAFATRVAELPSVTRKVLLIAAADDRGALGGLLAAANSAERADGGPTVDELVPAVEAGLAEIVGGRFAFRHPLVRSAVYQTASTAQRRAAHGAWAEVLADEPDRQVWHRAAALVGPDEGVAVALEAAARRVRGRGAIGVAIGALGRAAELSEDPARKAQRLLDAAELASETGRRGLALGFLEEAEEDGLGDVDGQRAILIREAFDTGEDAVSIEQIIEVAERTWHRDPDFAMNILRRAAGKAWWAGRSEERRKLLVAAVRRMGATEGDPQRLAIVSLAGSALEAAHVLGQLFRPSFGETGDPIAARLAGLAGYAVGHPEFAVDALTVAIDRLRAQGRFAPLAQAIVARAASDLQLGRLDLAVQDAEEGRRLSVEISQPLFAQYARAGEALLAGLRGDGDEAETIAADVERYMLPMRGKAVLWDVQFARGITALGSGRYADAYEHLIRTFDPNDPAEHFRKKFWALGDLAEAATHIGRRYEVRSLLAQAETVARQAPSPLLLVALGYARPLLAEDGEAEALYKSALGTNLTSWPFARARLQLAYGAWLRRRRRVSEARPLLSAAKSAFDALGVVPWSERTRRELRASGVMSQEQERVAPQQLTPQELQIVRLAASGLTNREIAEHLYLSHRTVGAHLYRAFPKLGITSRGQLRDALDSP